MVMRRGREVFPNFLITFPWRQIDWDFHIGLGHFEKIAISLIIGTF